MFCTGAPSSAPPVMAGQSTPARLRRPSKQPKRTVAAQFASVAGQYLCYSIRLRSKVALHIDQGAVIIAAYPLPEGHPRGYDGPEPDPVWKIFRTTVMRTGTTA